MRKRFYPVKVVLWLAFAATMTFGYLSRFDGVSVASIVCSMCALTFWLTRHRQELRDAYLDLEAKPKLISLGRLKLGDIAPLIVFFGLIPFHFASSTMRGAPPDRRERLAYELFGTPGVVGLWVIVGTVLLSFGIEAMLGARSRNET